MKNKQLDSLIYLIETKLETIGDNNDNDILLSKNVLEFILELAREKQKKQMPEDIVASEQDLYKLTEHKISYEQ